MTRYDCNLWYILSERKKKAKGDIDSPYCLKAPEIGITALTQIYPLLTTQSKFIVSYALDIIRGLEFLHSHNIIHRDLRVPLPIPIPLPVPLYSIAGKLKTSIYC